MDLPMGTDGVGQVLWTQGEWRGQSLLRGWHHGFCVYFQVPAAGGTLLKVITGVGASHQFPSVSSRETRVAWCQLLILGVVFITSAKVHSGAEWMGSQCGFCHSKWECLYSLSLLLGLRTHADTIRLQAIYKLFRQLHILRNNHRAK
jgi:hypothetical protein